MFRQEHDNNILMKNEVRGRIYWIMEFGSQLPAVTGVCLFKFQLFRWQGSDKGSGCDLN